MPGSYGTLSQSSRPNSRKGTRQVLINGRPAEVTMTTNQYAVSNKPMVVVHAGVVLDASSSMRDVADRSKGPKTKMDVTLDSLHDMYRQVLMPDDRCNIAFFNENYRQVFYNTKVASLKGQRARLDDESKKMGGCTALYDSTIKALRSMQATKDAKDNQGCTILYNLIVFTDGMDNMSKEHNRQSTVAELMKPGLPNFHATIIAVGSDAQRAADEMRAEVASYRRKNNVHIISTKDIREGFGASNKRMRKVKEELVEELSVRLVQNGKGAQPVMGKMLGKAAQQAMSGSEAGPKGLPQNERKQARGSEAGSSRPSSSRDIKPPKAQVRAAGAPAPKPPKAQAEAQPECKVS